MKITVKVVKENEDGSANASIDFDKEGMEFLIQEGLLSIMEQYITQNENAKEGMKLRKEIEVSHHKNGNITTRKVKK